MNKALKKWLSGKRMDLESNQYLPESWPGYFGVSSSWP